MSKLNVLVVDDFCSAELAEQLQCFNYNTYQARTLQQARTLLQVFFFDIIVLDLKLPDGNGTTFLEYIKGYPPHNCSTFRDVEVVILSGFYDGVGLEGRLIELGAFHCVNKEPMEVLRLPWVLNRMRDKIRLKRMKDSLFS